MHISDDALSLSDGRMVLGKEGHNDVKFAAEQRKDQSVNGILKAGKCECASVNNLLIIDS